MSALPPQASYSQTTSLTHQPRETHHSQKLLTTSLISFTPILQYILKAPTPPHQQPTPITTSLQRWSSTTQTQFSYYKYKQKTNLPHLSKQKNKKKTPPSDANHHITNNKQPKFPKSRISLSSRHTYQTRQKHHHTQWKTPTALFLYSFSRLLSFHTLTYICQTRTKTKRKQIYISIHIQKSEISLFI